MITLAQIVDTVGRLGRIVLSARVRLQDTERCSPRSKTGVGNRSETTRTVE